MVMNPSFISIADVPNVPIFERMDEHGPIVTSITNGVMMELDDIKNDEELKELQRNDRKLREESNRLQLKVQRVLEGLQALFVGVSLGRMTKGDATPQYNKLNQLLNEAVNNHKNKQLELYRNRDDIYSRKKELLRKILEKVKFKLQLMETQKKDALKENMH